VISAAKRKMNSDPESGVAGGGASASPVQIGQKKHPHWWQDLPRRLSFTRDRNRSMSESSDDGGSQLTSQSPVQSPTTAVPPELKKLDRRRFSESSANGDQDQDKEKRFQVNQRWNRVYGIPPECFVPPWV